MHPCPHHPFLALDCITSPSLPLPLCSVEETRHKKRELRRIGRKKMALKLNTITFQPQNYPPFAMPRMARLRSPKFFMASTLRSSSKWVLSQDPQILYVLFFQVFLCKCFDLLTICCSIVYFGYGLLLFSFNLGLKWFNFMWVSCDLKFSVDLDLWQLYWKAHEHILWN